MRQVLGGEELEKLMLLENPKRRRRRRYNPVGFDEFGNPIMLEGGNMYYNPYARRRRRRSNPRRALAVPATFREWTQGVDLMDAGAAVGGLAASTMIPGMLVPTTDTMARKLWKLTASLGSAVAAGALGKAMISASAGKAAIIGGVAGTAAQALGMFTNIQIGGRRMLGSGRPIGETMTLSPRYVPEGEQTGVILP